MEYVSVFPLASTQLSVTALAVFWVVDMLKSFAVGGVLVTTALHVVAQGVPSVYCQITI